MDSGAQGAPQAHPPASFPLPPAPAGYSGIPTFLRCPHSRDLAGLDVAVLGVPFDLATWNRPGARFGPRALRCASHQLAWGPQYPWPFDPRDRLKIVDYGDVEFEYGRPDRMLAATEAAAEAILAAGASLLALGGDHLVSLPLLRAHARRYGRLAVVHFDAHVDTWRDESYNHGSWLFHALREGLVDAAHSLQIGIRTHHPETHGLTVLDCAAVLGRGTAWAADEVRRIVGDAPAYLTFDIDCLDPSCAPGTGAPVCGGLTTFDALDLLFRLDTIRFVGMDLTEVAPPYDPAEITSLAGATLALHYLSLRAQHPSARPEGTVGACGGRAPEGGDRRP